MPYILEKGNESHFLTTELRRCNEDVLYENTSIPVEQIKYIYRSDTAHGLSEERIMQLAKNAQDSNVTLTPIAGRQLAKMEHKGKAENFLAQFNIKGFTKCKNKAKEKTQESLETLFKKEKRFNGRLPQILPQIASVCDYYGIPIKDAVDKFSIQYVRNLLQLGLSKIETVLCYTLLTNYQLSKLSNNLYIAQMVSILIDKSYRKQNELYLNAALWIANHTETDISLLEKVFNKATDLTLINKTTVENVLAQFSNNKALNEVAKIEKAYKKCNFKLNNCVCDLKKTISSTDKYKAEILEGNDPKQVMLGYDTNCCQVLGDAGESAMMHGLLHPKAGFWVITKKDSGKVVAQAESWELNENTLVFDNIEFANDAEIYQYKEIIGKWVDECNYENVIMGCAYNEFNNNYFRAAGPTIPPVTAYELYVLSYEDECDARDEICELASEEEAKRLMEDGTITYFDYVYCDSERASVYLKENGVISRFFTNDSITYNDVFISHQNEDYDEDEYEDDIDYDDDY